MSALTGSKKCSSCKQMLKPFDFSSNQLKLSASTRKCIRCINNAQLVINAHTIQSPTHSSTSIESSTHSMTPAQSPTHSITSENKSESNSNFGTLETALLACENDLGTWNYISSANGLTINVTYADWEAYHRLKQTLHGSSFGPSSLLNYMKSKPALIQSSTPTSTTATSVPKKILKKQKVFDCEQDGEYSNYKDEILEKLIEIQHYMRHDVADADERMNDLRLLMEQLAVVPLKECK